MFKRCIDIISYRTHVFLRDLKTINVSSCIFLYIFSFLFSEAFVHSSRVHFNSMRGTLSENNIDLSVGSCLLGLLLSFAIFLIVVKIFTLTEKFKIKVNMEAFSKKEKIKRIVIPWVIIFLCWLPYLLTFYPGGIVGDGACTLEEAFKPGFQISNHWVVMYILVLRLFLHLGSLFTTDINVGVFLYVITESLFFSWVCALVACQIYKVVRNKVIFYLITFYYSFSGLFALYSMTLWKDGIFATLIVLLVLMLWDFIEKETDSWKDYMKFSLLFLWICFWRNNGIHIVVLCILCSGLLMKKKGFKLLACGIGIIMITWLIQNPLYDLLGISKDGIIESISIPLQQVAIVINKGVELNSYQEEVLFSMLPYDDWITYYSPTLSDDLKFRISAEYINSHLLDFLKVWAQLLIPNFKTYVRAYLLQTLGYWQIGSYQGLGYDYFFGIQNITSHEWTRHDLIKSLTGNSMEGVLLTRLNYISSGTSVWVLLFSFFLIGAQKDRIDKMKRLMLLVPIVASWVIVMLSTPIAYMYRYVLMIPLAFPIIFILPFYRIDQNEKS